MKNVVLAAIMLVGMTTFAQEMKDGKRKGDNLTTEQRVDKRVTKLKTDLALNDKQTAEIKALMTKNAAKREVKKAELDAQKEKNRAEMKTRIEAEQTAMKAEMKKILTAEQYTKWEQQNAEKKAKIIEKIEERKAKRKDLKDKQ